MKRYFTIVCFFASMFFSGMTVAQTVATEGVHFKEQASFEEILSAAKEKNMNVFIDCYTTWCGPCRRMSTEVFPQKEMGIYFNANFLNYKEDMEKTTGLDIAKRFKVTAYPTFLILNSNGKEISRIVGSMPAADFLAKTKKVVETGGLSALQESYEKGKKEESFLFDYLEALSDANMLNKANDVAAELLEGRYDKMLTDKKYLDLFMNYINSPEGDAYKFIYNHRTEIAKMVNSEQLQSKLNECWLEHAKSFYRKDTKKTSFDSCMKDYSELMDKYNLTNKDKLINLCYLNFFAATNDWVQCLNYIKKINVESANVDDVDIISSALFRLYRKCTDMPVRKQALKITQDYAAYYKQKGIKADSEKEKQMLYNNMAKVFNSLSLKLKEGMK